MEQEFRIILLKTVKIFEETLAKLLKTGKPQELHYNLSVQAGVGHYESRMIRTGANEILMLIRDVTQEVHRQKMLEARMLRRQALLKALPDLVFRMAPMTEQF